jgi:hypothetical protein
VSDIVRSSESTQIDYLAASGGLYLAVDWWDHVSRESRLPLRFIPAGLLIRELSDPVRAASLVAGLEFTGPVLFPSQKTFRTKGPVLGVFAAYDLRQNEGFHVLATVGVSVGEFFSPEPAGDKD